MVSFTFRGMAATYSAPFLRIAASTLSENLNPYRDKKCAGLKSGSEISLLNRSELEGLGEIEGAILSDTKNLEIAVPRTAHA